LAGAERAKAEGRKQMSVPEIEFNIGLAFGANGGGYNHLVERDASGATTGKLVPGAEEIKKKVIQDRTNLAISRVGIAQPGTNKKSRRLDANARAVLGTIDFASTHPSSGGFTKLGKNAIGLDVVRDNTTGKIVTKQFSQGGQATPESRALGEQKKPEELASINKRRSKTRRTSSKVTSTGRSGKSINKNSLGSSSILGSESILG
jgi:hypothetical protein